MIIKQTRFNRMGDRMEKARDVLVSDGNVRIRFHCVSSLAADWFQDRLRALIEGATTDLVKIK